MKELKIIILAAGKGVRMRSATPKVLHPICGKPMIQFVVERAKALSPKGIFIVLGHKTDTVRRHLPKDISVIIQRKLLGTADAVKHVLPRLSGSQGNILILCGDAPLLTQRTLLKLIRAHKKAKAACTVLTSVVDRPQGYGRIVRGLHGDVLSIREEKDATPGEKQIKEINAGVYCFKLEQLRKTIKAIRMNKKKKEFYLTDIIACLVEDRSKVKAVRTEESYEGLGINTREDLALAEGVMQKRILRKLMLKGITIIDPASVHIDENVTIGQETVIRPFTVIDRDVSIGKKCIIGPFCHLRSGTKVGNNAEVGNFTEVCRSKIGNDGFMKHFSYLGDSTVGNRVNIGAGVVTANFDGRDKNMTRIADDAFIGSDSILVAPVTVGKKAVTGAGCVVTKGQKIPKGSVVAGVPAKAISRRKRK